jgi:pilus assembly protein CpaB
MKRRMLGIGAAVAMALFGTALLVLFVRDAEARAVAGEERVEVYVVDEIIAAGTPAELIASSIRLEEVPIKVRSEDAIVELTQLDGLLSAVDLLPGEQVLASRFVEPDLLTRTRIAVPVGTVELTLSLDPQRAVGGTLFPGDTVVVFESFDPFDIGGAPVGETPDGEPLVEIDGILVPADTKTPNSTRLVLEGVLVTNVQIEELPVTDEEASTSTERRGLAPSGNLLISVAVDPAQAERLVFGAEHGSIWLARQTGEIKTGSTGIQTRARIYEDLPL